MIRRTLLRGALAVLAAVAVSAIAWGVYGAHAFVACVEILGPLGAATTLLADLIANHRARIRGLRGQLSVLAVLAFAQLGAAVGLFAWLMFVSNHDALFMALAVGYAGLLGLGAARLVAARALSDLDAVRTALVDVGEGSREVRIAVRGKDELASLAAEVEAMAGKVADEESMDTVKQIESQLQQRNYEGFLR